MDWVFCSSKDFNRVHKSSKVICFELGGSGLLSAFRLGFEGGTIFLCLGLFKKLEQL